MPTDEAVREQEPALPHAEDIQADVRVESERLAGDDVQEPAPNGEAVTVTAPMDGAEVTSGESADEETTTMSHEPESKPEVTT